MWATAHRDSEFAPGPSWTQSTPKRIADLLFDGVNLQMRAKTTVAPLITDVDSISGFTQNLLDQINAATSLFAMRGMHMRQPNSDWDQSTSPANNSYDQKPTKRKWSAAEWEEYEKPKRPKYDSQSAPASSNTQSASGSNNSNAPAPSQSQSGTDGRQYQQSSPISVFLSITGKGVIRDEQKSQHLNHPDGEELIACLAGETRRLEFTSKIRCVFKGCKRHREQVPGKVCHFRHDGQGLRTQFPLRGPAPEILRIFREFKQLPQ